MKTPLQKVRRWLKEKGFELELRRGLVWQTNLTEKRLTGDPTSMLDYPLNEAEKLAMLLHECGHVDRQRLVVQLGTPWDNDLLATGKKRTSAWYIAVVREEMDAWDAADRLAKRLALKGLSRAMARMRRKCLMTYIGWAAQRGNSISGTIKK